MRRNALIQLEEKGFIEIFKFNHPEWKDVMVKLIEKHGLIVSGDVVYDPKKHKQPPSK